MDTRDRVLGGTTSNFSIALPSTLSLESGHQGRIDDFRFPMSVPSIYSGNSSIEGVMGGTPFTVYIDERQYNTGPDLAWNIFNKLKDSVPGNWTVDYDSSHMELKIVCSNPFQFTGGSWMGTLLQRQYSYSGGRTYIFPFVAVQGLDMCYLCCSQFNFSGQSVGPKGSSDILCAIPIVVGYGSVQHYSMSSSVFFDIPALTTQQLSFQLRDRNYNILNTSAGISFTLTID